MSVMARDLVREDVDVPLGGARLRLRHRVAPSLSAAERPVVLMAHGSTYSSGPTYDLPIDGLSMMDLLAIGGVDAWALDVVGYGGSSRPAAMSGDPAFGEPVSRTAEAIGNVDAAVQYLLRRYGRETLAFLGWSWGTAVMGGYAAIRPDHVSRLVQIAPLWTREGPSATDPGGVLGAFRRVDVTRVRARWINGLSQHDADRLAPVEIVTALERALLNADEPYSSVHPGVIHVPNGTVADTRAYWSTGKPLYDAGAITCPVLVLNGEWDKEWSPDVAERYVKALTSAQSVMHALVPQATHSLILEPARHEILATIIRFLGGVLAAAPGPVR